MCNRDSCRQVKSGRIILDMADKTTDRSKKHGSSSLQIVTSNELKEEIVLELNGKRKSCSRTQRLPKIALLLLVLLLLS